MGKNKIKSIFNSSTIMTWGSFLSKSFSLILVVPLVLKQFGPEEIALWFLFSTIIGLQSLIDLGFTPSFVRLIAYAFSGMQKESLSSDKFHTTNQINYSFVTEIYVTLRSLFLLLSLLWMVLLTFGGSFAVNQNIEILSRPFDGWICWIIIIFTSVFYFYSNNYSAFLQGINKIALLRRWETIFNTLSIFSSFIVLFLGGGLIELIIANQIWVLFSGIRNFFLVKYFFKKLSINSTHLFKIDKDIFVFVWSAAWKSGLGVIMSFGITQLTGVFYAQGRDVIMVGQYLFALRIITVISQFSQAPFYSKIPYLAALYAKNNIEEIKKISQKSTNLAFLSFIIPFGILLSSGNYLLSILDSSIKFPDYYLWTLLGFAFFIERFGAMHIQIYSLTNKIVWHIANTVSGLLNIFLIFILYKFIGVYSFPVAMAGGLILFYCWYSAAHSYSLLRTNFFEFEKYSFIPNFILFSLVIIFNYYVIIH